MLSEENNRIYLFWRGADWKPTFAYSDNLGLSWSNPQILLKSTKNLSIGLISAAIRETEEETNLKLIDRNLKNLWVLARAITPANQKIRFDTKFFVIDKKNFSNKFSVNNCCKWCIFSVCRYRK